MYIIPDCRILLQHFKENKNHDGLVSHHIPSKYSKEMASRSEVVSNHNFIKTHGSESSGQVK